MRTGVTQVPLHGGHCPPWLFAKMKELGATIIQVIVYEYGSEEVLRRLSDPVWFQTLGCVLGFDWHSSGLTTVVCGALKEGLHESQGELGLFFAGGKGKVSRSTPEEICIAGEKYGLANNLMKLQQTSRLVAKVDSAAVQDGYQLYHHFFVFNEKGEWAVVQQGMNQDIRYARRYHWLSEGLKSYVDEPHRGICGTPNRNVLNLVSHDNEATRLASVELCSENPQKILKIIKGYTQKTASPKDTSHQLTLWKDNIEPYPHLIMPAFHHIPRANYLNKILYKLYEEPPENYVGLLQSHGVGPGTLRALAMVSEVTHGKRPAFQDPVRYTFAHGGKDGFPFPVRRQDMEHSINVLKTALNKAKLGNHDKLIALRRLASQERRIEKRGSIKN